MWQHELERSRSREADLEGRRRKLSVIVEISRATSHHASMMKKELSDREVVHAIGDGEREFLVRAIRSLGLQVEAIPLHELDDATFANQVLILTELCRQAREKTLMAFRTHREMDAAAFTDFFDFLTFNAEECALCHKTMQLRLATICG